MWNGRNACVTKTRGRKQRSRGCTERASVLAASSGIASKTCRKSRRLDIKLWISHPRRGCGRILPSYRLMLMLSSFSSMFELVAERRFCLYLFVQASEHLPNNTTVPSSGHQRPETVSARFQNKGLATLPYIWYGNPNNRKYMTKGASQLYLAMPFYTGSSTHFICGWRFILTTFEKKLAYILIYQ